MKIVFVLILLAIILLGIAIAAFFWAVRTRQFDNLENHAYQILTEDKFVHDETNSTSRDQAT